MHAQMVAALKKLSRNCAVELASSLSTQTVIGYEMPKKGTMLATAYEFKSLYPHCVILVRVGETYESFGVDAAIVLDCNENVDRGKAVDTRLVFHASRIQNVLNGLLKRGFSMAVFEESDVLCTPRHRYLAQIVSVASPLYAMASDGDNTPAAKKVAAVMEHESGRLTVCLLDVLQRICQRLDDVDPARAAPLVKAAMRPIYVIRRRPHWLMPDETVILGADVNTGIAERLIDTIGRDMRLDPSEFTTVRLDPARCAPLTSFTMQQLGLFGDMHVPSLTDYCLPRGSRTPLRHQISEWLAAPPSDRLAAANRAVLSQLLVSDSPVPTFDIASNGRRQRAVQASVIDANGLRAIRSNAHALLNTRLDLNCLIGAIAEQRGCSHISSKAFAKVVELIDEYMRVTPLDLRDARGCAYRLNTSRCSGKTRTAYDAANQSLEALLSAWDEREVVYDARGVALRGRPDNPRKLPVYDRANRIVPNQYTTQELKTAETEVATSLQLMLDEDMQATKACVQNLQHFLPFVGIIESAALHIATLIDHARLSVSKHWNLIDDGADVDLINLVPYWMESNTTVLNRVSLKRGTLVILTAPNGGGKTTLLRAIAACILLQQCGLCAPCAAGSAAPSVDHLFVRAGGLDVALERRSSFSNEMHDLRTILAASGNVIALVDEPCSSTSTEEALRLLRAVMEHMPLRTTFVMSTHHHELEGPDTPRLLRLQMGADVVGDDCVANFHLKPGTCTNSLALQVALAVGIPLDIVRAARRVDDVETLIHVNLRLHNI